MAAGMRATEFLPPGEFLHLRGLSVGPRSQLCGCQLLQLPHTLAHTGSRCWPVGCCGQRWSSAAPWWPLSPWVQPLGQLSLGPPLPSTGGWHLQAVGCTLPTPGLELQPPYRPWRWRAWAGDARSSLTGFSPRGILSPLALITCSTWEPRQPSQLSHRRGLPVDPSHSVTWFISNIQMYSSLGTPSLRG